MTKKTFKDDNKRYNREEALSRASSFLQFAHDAGKKFEIAGSLRRMEDSVGDMDLLAYQDDKYWWHWAAGKFNGVTWAMGDRNLDFAIDGFPINIRFFSPKEWGAGLLYFTGSKGFNIVCRNRAAELGLMLNQYDLFDRETGAALNLGKKEYWILEKLGLLDKLNPMERK